MLRSVVVASVALAGLVTACTLFVDLGGLSEPSAGSSAADAQTQSPEGGADAASETSTATGYAAAVLADGPLAYYRLGEAQGTAARDELGGAPGTYSGAIAFGREGALAGDADHAVGFDGETSRLDLGSAFAFAGNSPFTLEAWVRPAIVNGNVRFVFSDSSRGGAPGADGAQMYFAQDFTLFTRTGAGETAYAGAPPLQPGGFVHVVATYDGTEIVLYLGGAQVGTAQSPQPIASRPDVTLAVGDSAGGQFFRFAGDVDEIAIYGKALPAARVAAHFAAAH